MALLLDKLFSSIAFGHFIVDFLNGQRAVLLTYLSGPLGLTNAFLGLISTLYSLASALMQPVFGYLSDRVGPRWIAAGGVLWMGLFFSLALAIPGPAALVLLILASFGSGAFHPAGSSQATLLGRNRMSGREATAASYFFVFGQLGFFFGPMVGGPLLDRWGPPGLLVMSLFTLPVGLFAGEQFRHAVKQEKPALLSKENSSLGSAIRAINKYTITGLVVAAACQSWIQQNIVTFLPKYMSDAGRTASAYGLLSALFMGGSALGSLLRGMLAGRFGTRRVIVASLGIAALPLLLIAPAGMSPWLNLVVPLAGLFNGATYAVIVVSSQRIIPGGMGLATGLILGFTFSSGALGALASGFLADAAGFTPVFYLSAGLAVLGCLAATLVERGAASRPDEKPQPGYSHH